MTYRLLIGQRSYSSWSLRGWLPFAVFDIPVEVLSTPLYSGRFASDVTAFGGSGTVPVAQTPGGGILTDSIAIAWHLAEAFPDRGMLPETGADRVEAQSIIAQMHTGFAALRGACPMNLRTAWAGFEPSEAVRADLARVEALWSRALDRSGGPWLYGRYTLADAFYAPVATRIATYGLAVSANPAAYVRTHLEQSDFRRWRVLGATEGSDLTQYEMPLSRAPFPAAPTIPARAVAEGTPENDRCPRSGSAPVHLAEIGGRIFGFGSARSRDETAADPEAWPAFMKLFDTSHG